MTLEILGHCDIGKKPNIRKGDIFLVKVRSQTNQINPTVFPDFIDTIISILEFMYIGAVPQEIKTSLVNKY